MKKMILIAMMQMVVGTSVFAADNPLMAVLNNPNDKEVVLASAKVQMDSINFMGDELIKDREFILALIKVAKSKRDCKMIWNKIIILEELWVELEECEVGKPY